MFVIRLPNHFAWPMANASGLSTVQTHAHNTQTIVVLAYQHLQRSSKLEVLTIFYTWYFLNTSEQRLRDTTIVCHAAMYISWHFMHTLILDRHSTRILPT